MLDKLQAISDRLEAIVSQMEDPATYGDPELLRRLTKEQKELEPVVLAYRAYRKAEADLASAQELLGDPEMKEMAQEEIQESKAEMERLREELKILLLPRDPNDGKNVVMEIRGGVGGEEAMLFAADLFRMYAMYVESRGWKLEVTSRSETELGGIKTIECIIEGEGAWSRLKYESGAHRVQRVPVTESSGRIQTSAATVAVLPEAEEVDIHIDPGDLKIDTF
ncbi:MAG: PCRF domain-containing protein, partial [Oscillospiraceae bacterium]|nr:PCRF domain-containing protein [Oscillospiraceae bacterium]